MLEFDHCDCAKLTMLGRQVNQKFREARLIQLLFQLVLNLVSTNYGGLHSSVDLVKLHERLSDLYAPKDKALPRLNSITSVSGLLLADGRETASYLFCACFGPVGKEDLHLTTGQRLLKVVAWV